MVHEKRRWQVATVSSVEELASELLRLTWTACTGFRFGGYLWLNDAFSEGGGQEYAVVHEESFRQVESVTVSWCDEPRLVEIAQGIMDGTNKTAEEMRQRGAKLALRIERAEDKTHQCRLCA